MNLLGFAHQKCLSLRPIFPPPPNQETFFSDYSLSAIIYKYYLFNSCNNPTKPFPALYIRTVPRITWTLTILHRTHHRW